MQDKRLWDHTQRIQQSRLLQSLQGKEGFVVGAKKFTPLQAADLFSKINQLVDAGFGNFSYKHLQWWCDICGHTICGSMEDKYFAYYRRVFLHYNYLHKGELVLAAMMM